MKTGMKDNYYVGYKDEEVLSDQLIKKIVDSEWVKPETILVSCFPEYSSRLTYLLAHRLSYLNANEPFEVMDLKMPYETMSQVWDGNNYTVYSKYLLQRTWDFKTNERYLFVGADAYEAFVKLKVLIRGRFDKENYRVATLFKPKEASFIPDYFAQEYEGKLLFQWENMDNPNK
jgi:hypothetical protein